MKTIIFYLKTVNISITYHHPYFRCHHHLQVGAVHIRHTLLVPQTVYKESSTIHVVIGYLCRVEIHYFLLKVWSEIGCACSRYKIYRITAILKVETDIITSLTINLIVWAVTPEIMLIDTFKTYLNVVFFVTPYCVWPINVSIIFISLIPMISLVETKRKNVQITDTI